MTSATSATNRDQTNSFPARATHEWRTWLASLGASLVLFVVARALSDTISVVPIAAYSIAFGCVALLTVLTSWLTPVTTPRALGLNAAPLLALAATRVGLMSPELQAGVVLISLLALGTLTGSVVGSRVQAVWHVLFVALVSSAADVFSVYAPLGPTAAIIQSETSLGLLALPWPIPGTNLVAPILGVGDVVFASLYRSATRAHRLSPARTGVALIAGFGLTLAALLVVERPIPALPFLGLAFVAVHPEVRQVPPAERKQAWIGAIALLAVLALLSTYRR